MSSQVYVCNPVSQMSVKGPQQEQLWLLLCIPAFLCVTVNHSSDYSCKISTCTWYLLEYMILNLNFNFTF